MKNYLLFAILSANIACSVADKSQENGSSTKTGLMMNDILACKSSAKNSEESFALSREYHSIPGEINYWSNFAYTNSIGTKSIFRLDMDNTKEINWMQRSLSKLIFLGTFNNPTYENGYVHIHADVSTKEVYLDAKINLMLACPSVDCGSRLNTKGLRKLEGFECTLNGEIFSILPH